MKIAILGFAGQGRSSLAYWNTPENEITVCDIDEQLEIPPNVDRRLGPDYLSNLDEFDLLVRTPKLHPRDIVKANLETPDILDKVTSNTEEFLRVCPTKNIIGITGTKGKGTTSTLTAKILEAAEKNVHLGGNIGTPPLDLLLGAGTLHGDEVRSIQPDDWVVLELANFQTIDLRTSPHIAACLMMVPEHLDWHHSFEEYLGAKQQLFRNQTDQDTAIYYGLNEYSQQVAGVSKGQKIPYMAHPGAEVIENNVIIDGHVICSVDDIKLLGKHNWQNVCAAVTIVWQITQDVDAIRTAITSFSGLDYRLEFVREFNNVKYYNDSFGTTPETAQVAIESFEEPKILILGGSSKGSDFSELAKTVNNGNVRQVLLIGDEAPKIQESLEEAGYSSYINGGTTMQEIVDEARNAAQPGDVVLLSTGCASFGLFTDYKDRGKQFNQAVLALA